MKLEKVNFFFNNEKLQKILFSLKIRQKSKFVIPQNFFLLNFAKIVLEIIFLSLPIPAPHHSFFFLSALLTDGTGDSTLQILIPGG